MSFLEADNKYVPSYNYQPIDVQKIRQIFMSKNITHMLLPFQDLCKTTNRFKRHKLSFWVLSHVAWMLNFSFLASVIHKNHFGELSYSQKITDDPKEAPKWLTGIKLESRLDLLLVEILCFEGNKGWWQRHKVEHPHSWQHGPVEDLALSNHCLK